MTAAPVGKRHGKRFHRRFRRGGYDNETLAFTRRPDLSRNVLLERIRGDECGRNCNTRPKP